MVNMKLQIFVPVSNDGECYEQQASPRRCLENILLLEQLVRQLLLVLPGLALHPVPLIGGQQPALNTVAPIYNDGRRMKTCLTMRVSRPTALPRLFHILYIFQQRSPLSTCRVEVDKQIK